MLPDLGGGGTSLMIFFCCWVDDDKMSCHYTISPNLWSLISLASCHVIFKLLLWLHLRLFSEFIVIVSKENQESYFPEEKSGLFFIL